MDEEKKVENEVAEDTVTKNQVVEESPEAKEPTEEELKEIEEQNKFFKRKLITLLICFVLSSVIYFVCKAFDPFKGLTEEAEIQTNALVKYLKYIMYFTTAIAVSGVVVFILKLLKINVGISRGKLAKLIDILEWVVIFPICIAVSTFCFSFVFTLTVVDGRSMEPTLTNGEQLVLTYNKNFERFDVVVVDVSSKKYPNLKFMFGDDYETLYIKRIIGIPGDTISYVPKMGADGAYRTYLYVNGTLVDEPFYDEFELTRYLTYETASSGNNFTMEHICDISNEKCVDDAGTLRIPEGYYLILGDNRGNSVDSRILGLVSKDDIVGKVKYRNDGFLSFKKLEK